MPLVPQFCRLVTFRMEHAPIMDIPRIACTSLCGPRKRCRRTPRVTPFTSSFMAVPSLRAWGIARDTMELSLRRYVFSFSSTSVNCLCYPPNPSILIVSCLVLLRNPISFFCSEWCRISDYQLQTRSFWIHGI